MARPVGQRRAALAGRGQRRVLATAAAQVHAARKRGLVRPGSGSPAMRQPLDGDARLTPGPRPCAPPAAGDLALPPGPALDPVLGDRSRRCLRRRPSPRAWRRRWATIQSAALPRQLALAVALHVVASRRSRPPASAWRLRATGWPGFRVLTTRAQGGRGVALLSSGQAAASRAPVATAADADGRCRRAARPQAPASAGRSPVDPGHPGGRARRWAGDQRHPAAQPARAAAMA